MAVLRVPPSVLKGAFPSLEARRFLLAAIGSRSPSIDASSVNRQLIRGTSIPATAALHQQVTRMVHDVSERSVVVAVHGSD
jgi:hypothetical protein